MAFNIAKLQAELQHVPDNALIGYVQNPNGQVPSYLALAELSRRKEIRAGGAQQAQQQQPAKPSVAQQVVQEAQPEPGVAGLPLQDSNMFNEQTMAAGGIVAFDDGGDVKVRPRHRLQFNPDESSQIRQAIYEAGLEASRGPWSMGANMATNIDRQGFSDPELADVHGAYRTEAGNEISANYIPNANQYGAAYRTAGGNELGVKYAPDREYVGVHGRYNFADGGYVAKFADNGYVDAYEEYRKYLADPQRNAPPTSRWDQLKGRTSADLAKQQYLDARQAEADRMKTATGYEPKSMSWTDALIPGSTGITGTAWRLAKPSLFDRKTEAEKTALKNKADLISLFEKGEFDPTAKSAGIQTLQPDAAPSPQPDVPMPAKDQNQNQNQNYNVKDTDYSPLFKRVSDTYAKARTDIDALKDYNDPYKTDMESGLAALKTRAGIKAPTEAEAMAHVGKAYQGQAYEDYEKSIRDSIANLGKEKDQAGGMALLKAGLAIMGGKSQYALQNIGAGAMIGAEDYQGALKDIKKSEKEANKGLAEIAQARRLESQNKFKEADAYFEKGRDRYDNAQNQLYSAVSGLSKDAKDTAFKIGSAKVDLNVKEGSELSDLTQRQMAEQGADRRLGRQLAADKEIAGIKSKASLKGQFSDEQINKMWDDFGPLADEQLKPELAKFGKDQLKTPAVQKQIAVARDQLITQMIYNRMNQVSGLRQGFTGVIDGSAFGK